jgi:tRNA threonylcarbamoyladenosine biosynthesis protein TsaE
MDCPICGSDDLEVLKSKQKSSKKKLIEEYLFKCEDCGHVFKDVVSLKKPQPYRLIISEHDKSRKTTIDLLPSDELEKGDVLCLSGDLGVGKTAFVQGLAKGLGIEEYISSPTFTIVNCYSGKLPFYHFDVYRIGDSEEMYEIGYEEYVYGDGISVIEWPQLISDILTVIISMAVYHISYTKLVKNATVKEEI